MEGYNSLNNGTEAGRSRQLAASIAHSEIDAYKFSKMMDTQRLQSGGYGTDVEADNDQIKIYEGLLDDIINGK